MTAIATGQDGRNWPFTMRVTMRERGLLTTAARSRKTSRADVARSVLNQLFVELEREQSVTSLR